MCRFRSWESDAVLRNRSVCTTHIDTRLLFWRDSAPALWVGRHKVIYGWIQWIYDNRSRHTLQPSSIMPRNQFDSKHSACCGGLPGLPAQPSRAMSRRAGASL